MPKLPPSSTPDEPKVPASQQDSENAASGESTTTDAQEPKKSPEFDSRIANFVPLTPQEFQTQLKRLKSDDVRFIEQFLTAEEGLNVDVVYQEVLPRLSPAYRAVADLENDNVEARRRAAHRLAKIGAEASLSPQLLRRLHEHMTAEQDQLVWRDAMSAVMQDAGAEAAQLALLSVNHVWPDIRILGCRYIARHGRSDQALWLLPLLHDHQPEVQYEAVLAAGRCYNPALIEGIPGSDNSIPLPGLRSLMTHTNDRLRFAAVVSLSRLGDRTGMDELARMSLQDSSAKRIDVVTAMGESGQSRFIEHLIRMAWTEQNDAVKRVLLNSLDQLTPAADHPEHLSDSNDFDARIRAWVDWWESRRATARARNNAEPVPATSRPPTMTAS